jgi:hypothetical protein
MYEELFVKIFNKIKHGINSCFYAWTQNAIIHTRSKGNNFPGNKNRCQYSYVLL